MRKGAESFSAEQKHTKEKLKMKPLYLSKMAEKAAF